MDREQNDTILILLEMAHEFQTPLAILRGNIEILDESQLSRNKEMRKQAVRTAQETLERLSRLVSNIMKVSCFTLERGGEAEIPVDIASLLQNLYDDCALLAEEKNIALHVSAPQEAYVLGSKDLLKQVLLNLMSNALKYTSEGGSISLIVKRGNGPNAYIEITVKDSGIGIAPENIPRVFERFYRIPGNEHAKGTGLGLHICRKIIQAHRGTIEVESELGHGSSFIIRVPELCETNGLSPAGAEITPSAIINKCKTP
jgi:two-component system, OmpR family, phosphate regulon sensor histidine kinase PhoR